LELAQKPKLILVFFFKMYTDNALKGYLSRLIFKLVEAFLRYFYK